MAYQDSQPEVPQEENGHSPRTITLPCAPQPYAAPGLTILILGLGVVLFGLYATSRATFPQYVEAANGVGLSLMCFGFSILLDSRPPAFLQFDPEMERMVIQESFFVRSMPSLALPYAAIERIEIGEPGFRHRVPVRILLRNGGTMTFRIAGTEQPIDDGFIERVGLRRPELLEFDDLEESLPFAPAGESDSTAGLLREFEGDGEISMVWKPRAFGRAVRFRLLSVLSLVLVVWALNEEVAPPVPGIILVLVAILTVWLLYRHTVTQRREYIAFIDPHTLSLESRGAGYSVDVPRSEIQRCGAFLDPDDPNRYLDIHGPDPQQYKGFPAALDPAGHRVGVRVPIGRLTYGEAIGLAARIELALYSTANSSSGEQEGAETSGDDT